MTAAQASIRQLYEQVRVLEAQAVRPGRRLPRLPLLFVLVAAAAIGAASAGSPRRATHLVSVHTLPAVTHLIDAPADRARPLPAPRVKRARAVHRAPLRVHPVVRVAQPVTRVAAPVVRVAPPVPRTVAPPQPVAAPVVHHRTVAPQPHPKASPVPVGIGPVVVATSDEPEPDSSAP